MSNVFVLDTNKTPLDPVHPGYARKLLNEKKASVFLRFPFTIILKTAVVSPVVRPLRVKINPGSKTSGIAVVNDGMDRWCLQQRCSIMAMPSSNH